MGHLFWSGELIDIAARRLNKEREDGEQQFWMEISMLSSLKHKNLASIVGFCDENNEKIIIKKRQSRGSLRNYIEDPFVLTWVKRLEICIGLANALRISLSDKQYNKYLAPILLKKEKEFLAPLAIFHYREKTLYDIIDRDLWKQMDPQSFSIFAETAYDCLTEERSRRPDIGEVVTRLEKALELQLPPENRLDMIEPEGKVAGDRSFRSTFRHFKIGLEAIKSATNKFDDAHCIGKGGFGKVYKGELVHSKGRYDNIVSLLGFCDDCGEKILIRIGAARGLAYLHNPGRTQQRVLHRDIKSSNILLDENWKARIADLGLSKFGPANQKYTFLVSNAVGTIAYCAPLYVATGLLTKESDVYSFGVVLFELLCGRLSIGNNRDERRLLTELVRKCYKQNTMDEIIYGDIKDEINPHCLKAFTTVTYKCLMREQEQRPLMTKVVKVLESALQLQVSNVPPPPSLSPAEPLASPNKRPFSPLALMQQSSPSETSWGELVDINESDNCSLSCIRVCVRTKPRVLINDRVKIIIKGQLHWICVKEQEAWMPEFKTVMEDDHFCQDVESEGNNENGRGSDNEHVSETSFAHENMLMILQKGYFILHEYPLGFTQTCCRKMLSTTIPGYLSATQTKFLLRLGQQGKRLHRLMINFHASGLIYWSMDELIRMDICVTLRSGWKLIHSFRALCLDKHLSESQAILLRELNVDYGPTPFRFFHSCLPKKGLICLKGVVFNKSSSLDMAQRPEIRWAIEGEKIPKWFHVIINKKHSQLVIHGVLADGDWIVEPSLVKNEFLKHFATRFASPSSSVSSLTIQFPNRLSPDQNGDLERNVSYEEIKRAVWDCGISKSPGPDDDVIAKLSARLSKWKLKSLSIGGRLTLIKSVLSSLPLYYMSSFKVPKGVLSKMESIRRNFFNGVENAKKKMSLIGWNKILASKKNGGLGVSSFFAYNRALLFKWIWRFLANGASLWSRFISAIYGIRGALDNSSSYSRRSPWLDIVNEVRKLASKGIDLLSLVKKKVENMVSFPLVDATRLCLSLRGIDIPFYYFAHLCSIVVESTCTPFLLHWLSVNGLRLFIGGNESFQDFPSMRLTSLVQNSEFPSAHGCV
ncbi:protein kinase, ATP binding site-containing protein [Tanacetum coccineum]